MSSVEPNPFVCRTVSVITGSAMEWSARTLDVDGVAIPVTSIVGSTIQLNTQTLIIYNTSATETIVVLCRTTAHVIDGGTGLFPDIVTAVPTNTAYIPPGGAFTIDIGPNGSRIIAPYVYVQALAAAAATASFVLLQTSGNLQLGR